MNVNREGAKPAKNFAGPSFALFASSWLIFIHVAA
jgi:hypothetical protein